MLIAAIPLAAQSIPSSDAGAEPYVIEGGGVSLQPWYWLTSSRPLLRPGLQSTATQPANLLFPEKANGAMGLAFAIPAGKQNTLRISYFRAAGSGDTTAATDLNLFGSGYAAGDFLTTEYKLQNAKLSWDYLSFTFKNRVRLKTLWEVQVASLNALVDAPLKDVSVDANGYVTSNASTGNKWLFYPTFGIGLEQSPWRRFRWEAKASGFTLPRYGTIWDIEGTGALRFGSMELLAGQKAFSVKTSTKDDFYLKQRLSGVYVGMRWYWNPM